jgi:hypothetical protein
MIEQTPVAVRSMTLSVKVLVVDGTRRVSHKFYEQIPRRGVIDEHGERVRREWNSTVDERNADVDAFNATIRQLRDGLPQVFVGG